MLCYWFWADYGFPERHDDPQRRHVKTHITVLCPHGELVKLYDFESAAELPKFPSVVQICLDMSNPQVCLGYFVVFQHC